MNRNDHPAELLARYMQRIYDRGLTTTSGGNLSVRDAQGRIWITPAGTDKGSLTPEDIVCVYPDGRCEGRHKPSSELPFHSMIYRMRPDLNAILHAHPVAPVAFSILRRLPELRLAGPVARACLNARIVPYDIPGSRGLGEKMGNAFATGCDVVILENPGICVGAGDMPEAFARFETMDYAARLELAARKLGEPHPVENPCRIVPLRSGEAPAGETEQRTQMIKLLRRCYRTGLFTATLGTCSVRLDDGSLLIPPDGADCASLTEAELLRVPCGEAPEGSTAALHERIYAYRPEVRAILQALPVSAMAFAVTGTPFDTRTIPESYILLQEVETLPMDPAQIAAHLTKTHPAVLVKNECAITTGETLLQAFDRMEVMECTAASILQAKALGEIVHITPEEIERIRRTFHLGE